MWLAVCQFVPSVCVCVCMCVCVCVCVGSYLVETMSWNHDFCLSKCSEVHESWNNKEEIL
jgi:hypothetical protein